MAMGTERSKALHNFTMPCGLRWGNPRILRCMRVNSAGQTSPLRRHATGSSGADHRHHSIQQRRTTRERDEDEFSHESPTKVAPTLSYGGRRFADDGDDGIAATREKVMLDLQTAADRMKDAIFKDGLEEGEVSASLPPPPPPLPPAADAEGGEAYCPWNLRKRRAACRTAASEFTSGGRSGGFPAVGGGSDGGSGKSFRMDAPRPTGSSPVRAAAGSGQKSPMLRGDGGAAAASGEKREREKFSVALSKGEIEEDFYAIVGHRPPRRPKKRARIVQKQLDNLFPGLWLTEVTADMYKVVEAAP